MKILTRLDQLSPDELARARRTLLRRHAVGQHGNILDIGFGIAEANDRLDATRANAVCFYVRRKRTPRALDDRIPPMVDVRLKRGHRFCLARLPSDVIRFTSRRVRLAGRGLRHLRSSQRAEAGCIVAWQVGPSSQWTWGVLSVGHLFWSRKTTPESEKLVRLRIGGNREMAGVLLARTSPRGFQRVDASIVQVVQSTLFKGNLLPADPSTRGKRVRDVEQLLADMGKAGLALPRDQRIPFTVARYFPQSRLFPELGPMDHVLDVSSEMGGAFQPGTSGHLWMIARQAACLQFAGWDTPAAPAHAFRRGLGQSLLGVLHWARDALAEIHQVDGQQVVLRVIREL